MVSLFNVPAARQNLLFQTRESLTISQTKLSFICLLSPCFDSVVLNTAELFWKLLRASYGFVFFMHKAELRCLWRGPVLDYRKVIFGTRMGTRQWKKTPFLWPNKWRVSSYWKDLERTPLCDPFPFVCYNNTGYNCNDFVIIFHDRWITEVNDL